MERKKLVVLIVDDAPLVVVRLIQMLVKQDCVQTVRQASNYNEAIDLLEREKPDVMLLDLNLPGKSGIDLLKTIQHKEWVITVIVLTNQAHQYYKDMCLSLGASYYLDKTNDFETIPDVLKEISLN